MIAIAFTGDNKPVGKMIALAGNPNVGKSTVFNALTGMNQHTGNWAGKTVAIARGHHTYKDEEYILVDLPGAYSLAAHSVEEEVARDFLLYSGADAAVVVCDATCLERNLNLVLQTMEITENVVVCVNLMDEAEKNGVEIDLEALERELGVPVAGTSARAGKGLDRLMERVHEAACSRTGTHPRKIRYLPAIEKAVDVLEAIINEQKLPVNARWLSLRLLEGGGSLPPEMESRFGDISQDRDVRAASDAALRILEDSGLSPEKLRDMIASCAVLAAEEVAMEAVRHSGCGSLQKTDRDAKLDRILTGRRVGIPIMLLLLCAVFWITITGANYPSKLLSGLLFRGQDILTGLFMEFGAPDWLHGAVVLGGYRVLAWVVSVMLPPMAIFFPLFTLLEDFGYLPRVAFNLDHYFKKARACGKQSLTMCMGFGCNAAGVTGCRIIDSPRERLIAILTNSLVPCNGRFPALVALIAMFFAGGGLSGSFVSALILSGVILLGILLTFLLSGILSRTVLKGEPSSFTLELPPYRMPRIGPVILRSVFDRTLFVLARAAAVAAPAGVIIWLLANVEAGGLSLLAHLSGFLDPAGRLLGMDGVILLAFILGFPANEIVLPVMMMTYLSSGVIVEPNSLAELKSLFIANGWTWTTAVSVMLFCLAHWPCSTTCLSIRKETGSLKWTALAFMVPTLTGAALCLLFNTAARLLGIG